MWEQEAGPDKRPLVPPLLTIEYRLRKGHGGTHSTRSQGLRTTVRAQCSGSGSRRDRWPSCRRGTGSEVFSRRLLTEDGDSDSPGEAQSMTRTAPTVAFAAPMIAAALLAAGLVSLPSTSAAVSETSAVSAPPAATATHISALAPAVTRPPQHTNALPSTGTSSDSPLPPAQVAAVGFVVLGALLVRASFTLQPPGLLRPLIPR